MLFSPWCFSSTCTVQLLGPAFEKIPHPSFTIPSSIPYSLPSITTVISSAHPSPSPLLLPSPLPSPLLRVCIPLSFSALRRRRGSSAIRKSWETTRIGDRRIPPPQSGTPQNPVWIGGSTPRSTPTPRSTAPTPLPPAHRVKRRACKWWPLRKLPRRLSLLPLLYQHAAVLLSLLSELLVRAAVLLSLLSVLHQHAAMLVGFLCARRRLPANSSRAPGRLTAVLSSLRIRGGRPRRPPPVCRLIAGVMRVHRQCRAVPWKA